jgi:FtsH-binding integral membrane protein
MNNLGTFFNEYILIPQAEAQTDGFSLLLGRINEYIINPLVVLLFSAGLVLFVFGLFNFFKKDDAESLEKGKRHMVWGIVGMAIMVSVFGIMNLITSSIGLNNVDPANSSDVSGLFR